MSKERVLAGMPAFLMLLLSFPAFAQNFSITGTVKDADAIISGVSISLHHTQSGVRQTTTNEEGKYQFDGLAVGQYRLSFTHSGFDPVERTIALAGDPSQSSVVDIVMTPGGVSSSVEVTDLAGKATASRMEIPDTEMPVQVSSVTRETLELQGVNDLMTALRNTSGVSARQNYGVYEYYTMRGFSGSAVLLVDGMRIEGNRPMTQLNNVEQVDVLKGPSSILYGGQALGGAINIIRKKPQATPAFDLSYRVGRFGLNQVGGSATGSIFGSNRFLYRIDSMFEDNEGWRKAGARRFNVSPTLTWLISEKARITFFQGLTRDNYRLDNGVPKQLYDLPGFDLSTRFTTKQDFTYNKEWQNQIFFNYNVTNRIELRNSFFYNRKSDEMFQTLGLTYVPELGQVNRTSLYYDHNRRPIQNQMDMLAHFDLLGMRHNILVGHEYQDFYSFTNRSAGRGGALPPISWPGLVDPYIYNPNFPKTSTDFATLTNNAFFWQDHIRVTKRLSFNVGGRFNDYKRSAYTYTVATDSRGADAKRHSTAYTYRAGAVYALRDNQQIYFNSSSSFSPINTIPTDGREFLPEMGRSYEVGHRWQPFGGRFKLSTAAYQMTRRNTLINLGGGVYDQAGQQSSKGIEMDANGNLGKGFRLVANYGWTQPVFDNYLVSNGTVDRSGRQPTFVPRHTGNTWITRQWNSGFHASVGARYMGRVWLNDVNDIPLGGWTTFSGAFGFRRGRYDWSVNAENLLNRERYVASAFGTAGSQVYPGSPINIFSTLRLRFR